MYSDDTDLVSRDLRRLSAIAFQIKSGSVLCSNGSMFSYPSLILSGVLAVMAAFWLLPRMRARAKPEVADEAYFAGFLTRPVRSPLHLSPGYSSGSRIRRYFALSDDINLK